MQNNPNQVLQPSISNLDQTACMQEQIYAPSRPELYKIDTLFYHSFQKSKNQYVLKIKTYAFLLATIAVYLMDFRAVFDQQGMSHETQIDYFYVKGFYVGVAVFNLLGAILTIKKCYANNSHNNKILIELAAKLAHCVRSEPIPSDSNIADLKQCISTKIYNTNTAELKQYTKMQDLQKKELQCMQISIQEAIIEQSKIIMVMLSLGKLLSLVSVVLGIFGIMMLRLNLWGNFVLIFVVTVQGLNIFVSLYMIYRICVRTITRMKAKIVGRFIAEKQEQKAETCSTNQTKEETKTKASKVIQLK